MAESLGEKLRQAREAKGVSISEVAEQTRISALYLESIENDDYRPLPGGIFNKGFVKSFAKYVGFDENEAMQDYARISVNQENTIDEDSTRSYRPEVLTDDSSGPSMLPTIILAAIILGLMTWGILALVNWLQTRESQTVENNIANNNVKVVEDNSNTNANTNAATSAIPSTDSIKVKITAPELAITATIDGKSQLRLLNSTVTEQIIEAEESLKLSYSKWLAETVKITLNGKKIETPLPPPGYKRNGFDYEINMDNLKQILKDGKISFGVPGLNTNTNATPAIPQAKPNVANTNVAPK